MGWKSASSLFSRGSRSHTVAMKRARDTTATEEARDGVPPARVRERRLCAKHRLLETQGQRSMRHLFLYTPTYYGGFHETRNEKHVALLGCQEQLLPTLHASLTMARWLASTASDYAANGARDLATLPDESRIRAEGRAVKAYVGGNRLSSAEHWFHTGGLACEGDEDAFPNIPDFIKHIRASFTSDSPLRVPLPWQEPWVLYVAAWNAPGEALWDASDDSKDNNNQLSGVPVPIYASWHPNTAIRKAASGGNQVLALHYSPTNGRIYGHHVDEIDTPNYQPTFGECGVLLEPHLRVKFMREEWMPLSSIPENGLSGWASPVQSHLVRHVHIHSTADA